MARKILAMLALLISGCASYTPRVDPNEKPLPEEAFVFGRFSIRHEPADYARTTNSHPNMGLNLQCEKGGSYLIRFDTANPVQVIKVRPDTCSAVELVFSDADGMIKSRKPYSEPILQGMKFKPGAAYYIGDFSGFTNVYNDIGWAHTLLKFEELKSNYQETTSEMQVNYSGISSLPIEDILARR